MKRLIMVEGIIGSGKSSVSTRLAQVLDAERIEDPIVMKPILDAQGAYLDAENHFKGLLAKPMKKGVKTLILDRGMLSFVTTNKRVDPSFGWKHFSTLFSQLRSEECEIYLVWLKIEPKSLGDIYLRKIQWASQNKDEGTGVVDYLYGAKLRLTGAESFEEKVEELRKSENVSALAKVYEKNQEEEIKPEFEAFPYNKVMIEASAEDSVDRIVRGILTKIGKK